MRILGRKITKNEQIVRVSVRDILNVRFIPLMACKARRKILYCNKWYKTYINDIRRVDLIKVKITQSVFNFFAKKLRNRFRK